MNAIRWWWFTPVHPSACIVASRPFAAAFVAARKSATAVGISRLARTFLEGLFAAGKNSSTNPIHSALSTHESSSPAEAVIRATDLSKIACRTEDQAMTSGTSREDVRRLPDCDDARRSGIVYNIGEAETDVPALFGIDGLYDRPSANGIGKGNNDGDADADDGPEDP